MGRELYDTQNNSTPRLNRKDGTTAARVCIEDGEMKSIVSSN